MPFPQHSCPTRHLTATGIRSTGGVAAGGHPELGEAAISLWHACLAIPAVAATAVLLLAEGLLLVPLWAAIRCATAVWQQLRRPTGPSPTQHSPVPPCFPPTTR